MSVRPPVRLGTYHWPRGSTECASSATLNRACALKGYEFALVYNILEHMQQQFEVITFDTGSEQILNSTHFGAGFGNKYDLFTSLEPANTIWAQNVSFTPVPTAREYSAFLVNPFHRMQSMDIWHPFQGKVWCIGLLCCLLMSMLHTTIITSSYSNYDTASKIYDFHFSRRKLFGLNSYGSKLCLAIYSICSIAPTLQYKRLFINDFSPFRGPVVPFRSMREFLDVEHNYRVAYFYDFDDRFDQPLSENTLFLRWQKRLKSWHPMEAPSYLSFPGIATHVEKHIDDLRHYSLFSSPKPQTCIPNVECSLEWAIKQSERTVRNVEQSLEMDDEIIGVLTITDESIGYKLRQHYPNLCVYPIKDLSNVAYTIPIYKNVPRKFKEKVSKTGQLLAQYGFDLHEEIVNLETSDQSTTPGCLSSWNMAVGHTTSSKPIPLQMIAPSFSQILIPGVILALIVLVVELMTNKRNI